MENHVRPFTSELSERGLWTCWAGGEQKNMFCRLRPFCANCKMLELSVRNERSCGNAAFINEASSEQAMKQKHTDTHDASAVRILLLKQMKGLLMKAFPLFLLCLAGRQSKPAANQLEKLQLRSKSAAEC